MYSLQNRTKNELSMKSEEKWDTETIMLWTATAENCRECLSCGQWSLGCGRRTDAENRLLDSHHSLDSPWFPHNIPQPKCQMMPNDVKWCQMPRPPKITLPAEHMRIKADSVTSATLPSLFICSLRAVQTLSDLCWSDWSVISAQNWPILTHPGTLITAFEIPLWPWWSSTNAALHSDEETFTIENNSALGDHTDIILTTPGPLVYPSMLTTALGISYVFGDSSFRSFGHQGISRCVRTC